MDYTIGLDIGGTKIAAGLITPQGKVLYATKVPSDTSDSESMFQSVKEAIDQTLAHGDSASLSLGAGVPGYIDREHGIALFQNNLPWANFPFVARLRKAYPQLSRIVMDNDVCQAAYAEWVHSGLGSGETLVYITVSTGIGCTTVTSGNTLLGRGYAGELGQVPIATAAGTYPLEQLVGGRLLEQRARQELNEPELTNQVLFERYWAKEPKATAIVNQWLDYLVLGVATVITLIDPQQIVFGGSIMKYNPQLLTVMKPKLAKLLTEHEQEALNGLSITSFDNDAGLIGAGLSAAKPRD